MDTTQDDLQVQLQRERDSILSELAAISEQAHYPVGYGNHNADDASVVSDQATNVALQKNAERLLAMVEEALERLDAGTYGLCKQCHEPIDPARIKAIPYADLCLYCADHPPLVS